MLPCTRPYIKDKTCNTLIKNRCVEIIIGTTVNYGSEFWTLTNKMERALMVWEMKIL